jgi:hypothetical protein
MTKKLPVLGGDTLPYVPTREDMQAVRKSHLKKQEIKYLMGELEMFEKDILAKIDPNAKYDGNNRFTPVETFERMIGYIKRALSGGRSLTMTGLGISLAMSRQDFYEMINEAKGVQNGPYNFVKDIVFFVEYFMEYTAQQKQNPAFQIFWLKNRGWVDKLEISASSTPGAMTDKEREEAQARLKQISEVKH